MNQQGAEQALLAWASFERDELVRAAHAAGVSKNRIHTITGIARTTIDRILDPLPMNQIQHDRLVDYVTRYTAQWPRQPFRPAHMRVDLASIYNLQPAVATVYNAQEVANKLFADAEFKALKLGTFLNTPDGRLLASAVEALTPPPYEEDVALLIEALRLAAMMQHEAARAAVRKGVLVAVGAGLVAALANGSS